MKTSITWIFRSVGGKIMLGLILAAMIGSIDVAPAFSKDDHKTTEKHDNGRSGHRGGGNDRGRYDRGGYQPYGYAPPPVIYAPPPEPGIDVFLPPIVIR